ncbi:MAG: DNA primase [Ardenticatenia bacterium]|nr:DNA primase [Ardenticatenia bacterium]
MASNRVVAQIKERLDIVEVVGRYVSLKRSGRTYKALCPFHQERTPSFVVFPHTGTWHCFGACGEGGDIFTFVMKAEGFGFAEALAMLAREAGVELEPLDAADAQRRQRRERLYAICEAAAEMFAEWLWTRTEAQACRHYLKQRQVRPETARLFRLGYALDRWEALLKALTARGYSEDDLEAAGLVVRTDHGHRYDRFRHRLIFPIRDVRGRVVGFGARALDESQQPKYLNSPHTELFDKGRLLYGLEIAKEAIRQADRVVIVEGYMDVLTAHQAGFRNVVAGLGTALTPEQVHLVKRFTTNVTLALDADKAGLEATRRGVEAVRQVLDRRLVPRMGRRGRLQPEYELQGDLRVAVLPDGYDPDELIKESPEQWQALIEGALPVVDFFFEAALRGRDLDDPRERAEVADQLLPIVAEIGHVVLRAHYAQRLARLLRVDERDVHAELARYRRRSRERRRPSAPEVPTGAGPAGEVPAAEAYLLYMLLRWPETLPIALDMGLQADDWSMTEFRVLFDALIGQMPSTADAVEELLADLPAPVAERAADVLTSYDRYPQPPQEAVEWEVRDKVDAQDTCPQAGV